MRHTHRADLFRQKPGTPGASQFDAPAETSTGWEAVARGVRCSFDPRTGDVRRTADGREVQVAGTMFVRPGSLPEGVVLAPQMAVAFTEGRVVVPGRFAVVEVRPVGGGGRFDDEADLELTQEEFE